MEKINKSIKLYFGFALGLSIAFPFGVLGIIFGAIYSLWALLALGITLAVAGFYAMPLLWVKFGEKRQDRSLLYMIEHEYLYTVPAIATQMGMDEKLVREKLRTFINKNIITGYLFVDDALIPNNNEKQEKKKLEVRKKCDNCGAEMIFDGEKYLCEYCLTTINLTE